MQTRRKTRSKRGSNFSTNNHESDNYDSEDESELNTLQKSILQTKHPFEMSGLTDGKPVSLSVKAITYFINKSGGWAHEKKIFQFLNDKWTDIAQISKKLILNSAPKLRTLHMNLKAKKKGQLLFIKKDPSSMLYRVNTGAEGEIPDDIEEERVDDSNEKEDELEQENCILKGESQFVEEEDETNEASESIDIDSLPFESNLMKIMNEFNRPVNESEILKKAIPYANCKGMYSCLDINQRVRACLINLKINKEIFVVESDDAKEDMWSLRPPVPRQSKIMFVNDIPNPISDLPNIDLSSLLSKRCQTLESRCIP